MDTNVWWVVRLVRATYALASAAIGGPDAQGAMTGAKTGAMTGKIGRRLLVAPYFSTKGVKLGTSKVNGQT